MALDNPRRVSLELQGLELQGLELQGASRLEIYCTAANTGANGDDIDVVIGNAILSPSSG